MRIFLCNDSVDGIFSGIYDAWASKLGHANVKLQMEQTNYELFAEYQEVPVDGGKAAKVAGTLRRRMGEEDYTHIYQAALSKDSDKAECIYRTVVQGLAADNPGLIMRKLQDPFVCRVFEMSRNIGNEAHHYLGFLRFRELKNGVLFSEIQPDNQVLPLIGEHFADRFPNEHFLIYDSRHQVFVVHEAYKQWVLVEGETLNREMADDESENEALFQELWKGFHKTIAIKERRNLRLQQQVLPLKFRKYLPEEFE